MSSNSQNRRKLNDDHDEVMKSYLVNGIKAGAVAGVGATAAVFGLQRYSTYLLYTLCGLYFLFSYSS